MAEETVCSTCKRSISNLRAASFMCPSCGKGEIIRCSSCRANAVAYECAQCNFRGPN